MDSSKDVNDQEIFRLLREDAQQGYTLLLQRHGGRVRGYLRKRFPSLDAAEVRDCITDAMLALAGSFDPHRGTLPAWFLLLSHQQAAARVGTQRKRLAMENSPAELPEPPAGQEPWRELVTRERIAELHKCIEQLPPLEREVVQADLEAGGGVPARDLASSLATTEGSVYAARRRARRKLQQRCAWIQLVSHKRSEWDE
jgi:RNA polymerase sigma factor (sigma-70 family)